MPHIVCIASEHKGNEFLEQAHEAGWNITLVTRRKLLDEPWAWSSITDVSTVDDYAPQEDYVRAITNVCGRRIVDRVVGLDEFDITTAARAREHLQLGGMSVSHSLRFRDKLTMRNIASTAGVPCPQFTAIFNRKQIDEFLERVDPPWIIKPRFEVSAFGIRKCNAVSQVWDILHSLDERNTWRDHPSQFLLEQFIEGEVFHVDSVVREGEVIAAGVSKYGTPPYSVTHHGGVFSTSVLPFDSEDRAKLEKLNKHLLNAFNFSRGVTHAEFLKGSKDGEFYLLEVACRVGGAYIANVLEYACNFNLWREWAKIETETEENPYKLPPLRQDYAGIVLALANTDWPDTSIYEEPEIVYRVRKRKHVGLIFYSKDSARLTNLLNKYSERIANDFLAVAPAKERYDD